MTSCVLGSVRRAHARRPGGGGLDPAEVERVIRRALEEDLAFGPDVTTELHRLRPGRRPPATSCPARRACSPGCRSPRRSSTWSAARRSTSPCSRPTATAARPGEAVLTVAGPTRALLTAERTALNLIGHLSGIATLTRHWVDAVAGTGAAIRDTRKTTPGLRALEKYAVRCGGGVNHRMALGDAALVKDNHVAAAGGIAAAVEAVRDARAEIPLEVECDTLDQVREAIDAGVELVLLDNFSARPTPVTAVDLVPGPRAAGWRPAAGCRSTARARSPRPASTTWPSARSPTALRCSTWASTCATERLLTTALNRTAPSGSSPAGRRGLVHHQQFDCMRPRPPRACRTSVADQLDCRRSTRTSPRVPRGVLPLAST